MKTKTINFVGAALGLAIGFASFNSAMANDEQYLNSDPININGYVQQAPPATHPATLAHLDTQTYPPNQPHNCAQLKPHATTTFKMFVASRYTGT